MKVALPAKKFVLNVNGTEYTYKVYGTYSSVTSEENYRYTELYATSEDTEEFSSCILAFFFKVEGNGTYEITNFSKLISDVGQKTDNKYVNVQVSLGSDPYKVANDMDIVRYGSPNDIGTVDVLVQGGKYTFKIEDPANLTDMGRSAGTPPPNAPKNIVVDMPNMFM